MAQKKPFKLPRKMVEEANLDSQRTESAQARVGEKPIDRLRWLLAFMSKPVSDLDPAERIPIGYELRAIAGGQSKPGESRASAHYAGPLDDEVVKQLHAEITTRVKGLFSSVAAPWQFKLPELFQVYRTSPITSKRILFATLSQFGLDQERDAILYGVANVLLDANRTLRACAQCGSPFIPVRRQEYCSTKCSQKARDKRRSK